MTANTKQPQAAKGPYRSVLCLVVLALGMCLGASARELKKSVTWENLRVHPAPLPIAGELQSVKSSLDAHSFWSIGVETMDRDYADFDKFRQFVGETGAGYARLQSGWAKTEQKKGKYDFTRVDSLINAAIGNQIVPGAVLCVARGDSILYRKAYGYRQLVPVADQPKDWKGPVPMTENTVFDLASCTKVAATTLAVMQLWEQGRLNLDAPVGEYLKPFQGQDLRVMDLLTHTSGIGDQWKKLAGYDRFIACGDQASSELVKYLALESPRSPRNIRYRYACSNFFLLQQIVEAISGEPLCDYVQKHIYSVLGLQDTRFLPLGEPVPDEYLSRVAPELAEDRIGLVHDPFARRICRGNAGNAGLFSTAEDLAGLSIALMNGGRGILKPETIAKMATVVDERFGRAIGWDVHAAKSVLKGHSLSPSTIVHGGYTGTMIAIDLENKISIVLLANRCHPGDAHYAAWQNAREVISTEIGRQLLPFLAD